jgi:hypothetical protein
MTEKNKRILSEIRAQMAELEALSEKNAEIELGAEYDELKKTLDKKKEDESKAGVATPEEDGQNLFSDSDLEDVAAEQEDKAATEDDTPVDPVDTEASETDPETDPENEVPTEDADPVEDEEDSIENIAARRKQKMTKTTKEESVDSAFVGSELSESAKIKLRAAVNAKINEKTRILEAQLKKTKLQTRHRLRAMEEKVLAEAKKVDEYAKYLKLVSESSNVKKANTEQTPKAIVKNARIDELRAIERRAIRNKVLQERRQTLRESTKRKAITEKLEKAISLSEEKARRVVAGTEARKKIKIDEADNTLRKRIAERREKFLNENRNNSTELLSEADTLLTAAETAPAYTDALLNSITFLDRISN